MKISLIVPVFNEEQSINLFYQAVRRELRLGDTEVEIVFINDGSSDRTAEQATALAQADDRVMLINFSRNFGKEPALFAGLEYASGDAVIPMDVDLQDPINVIPLLIEQWQKGPTWYSPSVAAGLTTATSGVTARRFSTMCSIASPTPASRKTSGTSG